MLLLYENKEMNNYIHQKLMRKKGMENNRQILIRWFSISTVLGFQGNEWKVEFLYIATFPLLSYYYLLLLV